MSQLTRPATTADGDGQARKKRKIDNFRAANFCRDDTDFTIKLGDHKWKVQSDVLTTKSTFFQAACEGGFEEASTRVIELHDDDPLHFVRLIQFVYTAELLSTGERSAADHAEERDALNILCGLWKLAMKYDILSLRKTVAPLMVDQVLFGSAKYEYNNHKWTHSSLCQSAGKFIKVYELLEPSFSDNQMMKVLESRMARFLVIGKIQMARYGLQTSFMRPYSVVISEDSRGYFTHKDSSTFSNLQTKVSSYLKNSPRFKTKYAEEMEKSLHQALTQNTASWGHRDWAALENHS